MITIPEKKIDIFVLGITNTGRKLFTIITIRKDKIRPISVREMTPRERRIYENS
ncbi:putative toxin-antitoxin system, toxin component [Leptospira interrogans serovar Hebdomadis str. R499]|nr:putative toxin-antitoxin system, toxin component [Leptospira interrogans serovar Hebdomadis str. R499]